MAGIAGQTNRETKTTEAPCRWIRFTAGMYLIRLAFAASAVGLEARRARRAEWLLSGEGRERTSVSAGNEALATIPRRLVVSDLLSPNLSSSPPFLSPSSSLSPYLAVVVKDENRIYIPSLAPR